MLCGPMILQEKLSALDHGRQAAIGGANPPVIPVAVEITPDQLLDLIHRQIFRVVTSVKELFFHSGPHTFTPCVIMTPATSAVHALTDTIFVNSRAVGQAGVLAAPV